LRTAHPSGKCQRGGCRAIENVWVLDHQVDSAKGTLSLDEFVALCRHVVAHQGRGDG